MSNANIEIYTNQYILDIATSIAANSINIEQQNIESSISIESNAVFLQIEQDVKPTHSIHIEQQVPNTIEINTDFSTNIYANTIIGLYDYIDNFITNELIPESGIYISDNLNIGISGIYTTQIHNLTASASELNYLDLVDNIGLAQPAKAIVLDNNNNIANINNLSTTGNINIGGDLIVSGSTTNILSTSVSFADNVITLNTNGLPAGGFRVYDGGVYQSLLWVETNNRWEFSGDSIYTTGTFIGAIRGGTP
jgi:hypothetical protein